MNSLQNRFVNDAAQAFEHLKMLLGYCNSFLESPIYKTATFVLLWKLIAKIPNGGISSDDENRTEDIKLISDVMVPFVHEHIDSNEKFDKYTKFLKFVWIEFLHFLSVLY